MPGKPLSKEELERRRKRREMVEDEQLGELEKIPPTGTKQRIQDRMEAEEAFGIRRGFNAWPSAKEKPELSEDEKKTKKNILEKALQSLREIFDWGPKDKTEEK